MTTAATWRKTLDGEDVYVQPDGWVWSHVMKGWFYAPDLSLQVPPPPVKTRAKDEVHRLTHGWPSPLRAFLPWNGVRGASAVFCWIYQAVLAYAWFQVIFVWGAHHVAASWQRFVYGLYKGGAPYEPVWWDEQPQDATHIVGLLFVVMVTFWLWYLLYMNLCYTVDRHKGHVMFGGLMAYGAFQSIKRNRAHDAMVAVRDGTRAAGGH